MTGVASNRRLLLRMATLAFGLAIWFTPVPDAGTEAWCEFIDSVVLGDR
jgi:hypothetical protein